MPDSNSSARVTLRDAAIRLGVSEGAIRKRVARGTIRSEMGDDGLRYVWVDGADGGADNGDDASSTRASGALRSADELIEELRDEVHYLREQLNRELERRSAESERYQRIVAGLTQANTNLTERLRELEPPAPQPAASRASEAPQAEADAPTDARGSPEAAEPRPDRGTVGEEGQTATAREQRPWWRRLFGE